ncbi:hypothetical protein M514_11761, partial [Trichuris suis]
MDEPLDYSLKTTLSTSDGCNDESSSCQSQPYDTSGHNTSSYFAYSPMVTNQRATTCSITPTIQTSLFNSFSYLLNSIALEPTLTARHFLGPLVTPLNGSSATSLPPLLGQTSSLVGTADSQSATQVSTAGSEIASLLLRRRRKYESRVSNENPAAPQETPSDRKEKLNSDEEQVRRTLVAVQSTQHVLLQSNAYWERRRRNNNAAKRSRAARRVKEEEIALRAAYLEQENLKLKAQVAVLKNESARLHCMLINHSQAPL